MFDTRLIVTASNGLLVSIYVSHYIGIHGQIQPLYTGVPNLDIKFVHLDL